MPPPVAKSPVPSQDMKENTHSQLSAKKRSTLNITSEDIVGNDEESVGGNDLKTPTGATSG